MKTKYYVLIGMVMLLFVLVVANVTHADTVIGSYTNHSTVWRNATYGGFTHGWPPPLTSSASALTKADLYLDSGGDVGISIECFSAPTFSSPCAGWSGTVAADAPVNVTSAGVYTFTWASTPPLSIGDEIYIKFDSLASTVHIYGSASPDQPYGVFYGMSSPPPPTDNTTRIISTVPANNEATTSPVALSMQYYVDASSSLDTTEVSIYRLESGNSLAFHATGVAATGTITTWLASSSASLPDGLYSAFWSLTNSSNILYNVSTSTSFIVGTSTWQQLLNLGSSTATTIAATSSCSIIDVGCNVIAALTWAFVPSQVSLQLLAQASNALYTAPPVGYLKAYQDTVRIAFSTSTPDSVGFSGDAIDVIGAVYGTSSVRTGLVAGYWAAFAIFFYSGTIALIHAVL